jgi:hypothetical protein
MNLLTITVATVLSMCFNSVNTPIDNNNNAENQNERVSKVEVYQNRNISPKYEYRLSYDGQNRLINKEAYRWDESDMTWKHSYEMTYNYSDNSYTIARSFWNPKTQTYNQPTDKAVYQTKLGNVVSVSNYKLNAKKSTYVMTGKIFISNTQQKS